MSIKEIKQYVDEQLKSSRENNAKIIKHEIESGKIGGRYCLEGGGPNVYYVVAATSTDEDYYWVCIDKRRNVRFSSCVGRMDPVADQGLDFSILDYLIKHDPKSIYERVIDYINSTGSDYLFTKINIGGKLY
jgi:hypothetical protein